MRRARRRASSRRRSDAIQHSAHSAAVPWTTKFRVNRPQSRPRRRAARTSSAPAPSAEAAASSACQAASGRGEVRPSQVATTSPRSPARAAGLDQGDRPRVRLGQAGHEDRATGRWSRRRSRRASRTLASDAGLDDARRRPRPGTGRRAGRPPPSRRRRTSRPARAARAARRRRRRASSPGRHARPPDARGQLQGAAAAGRPPPGHHAAGHVVGAEPAVVDPRVHPRPAVGAEQAGQLLVREQRLA